MPMNINDLLFERVVSRHVDQASFISRSWLANRIKRHLTDPNCRFVLLTGEPGVGKSGMIAWLARRHPDALRYFIRSDSVSPLASGTARAVLTSFGHQLAARMPGLIPLSGVDISVEQRADRVPADGRLTGIHAGELAVSPFWPTAVKVTQQAGEVVGGVVGIEADRVIADENLIELGELERMALRDPAARLAAAEPQQRILILIDALDELRFQPGGGSLLDWLASCAELPGNVRIVLSARPDPNLLDRFRSAQRQWLREEPVDPRDPLARNDVGSYLAEALPEHATAERIAERAAGNFQYAVAYVRAIESLGPELLTTPDELPADLNALYSHFLILISDGTRDMRVPGEDGGWQPAWPTIYLPVLAVLAIARGPLKPDEIAVLAGLRADREWLDDALGRLSQFLTSDDGLIQLFHASMAEFLVSAKVDAMTWNRRVVDHAKARYGDAWDTASPYVRRYLAAHAAAADTDGGTPANGALAGLVHDTDFLAIAEPTAAGPGILSSLVQNADFLAVADPVTLSPLLSLIEPELPGIARAYRRARPLLGDDLRANAAYLQEISSSLTSVGLTFTSIHPRYRTRLASVRRDDSLLTLIGHKHHVTSVAFGTDQNGRLLLASADDRGTVRIWDPVTGTSIGTPIAAHANYETVVAFGTDRDGHLMLASGNWDRTVRIWDPVTGAAIGRPLTAHIGFVSSVGFGTGRDGRLLLASGDAGSNSFSASDEDKGGKILIWDPVTGTQAGRPLAGHTKGVTSLAFGTDADGRLVLVSGGHDPMPWT